MDNGLLRCKTLGEAADRLNVLILIVMDNGLLLRKHGKLQDAFVGLNPYCNG